MYDGLRCYMGISSYQCADDSTDDCYSDNCNPQVQIKYTYIQSIILYADCCYHIGSYVCESLYIFQPAL